MPSVEIFYTFMISSLLAFLSQSDHRLLDSQLRALSLSEEDLKILQQQMSKTSWLGVAERLVFESFRKCADYVSPFSINNPDGWRYWFIHFANSYRARQVYNNILHANASTQAHCGRAGLNMLQYDPRDSDGSLYLFGESDRAKAKDQLLSDVPKIVRDCGDAISVLEFYETVYNMTPAHSDDVGSAMIENGDLEVVTKKGGIRRKANTIDVEDTLRLKVQRSFFPIFFDKKD